MYPVLREVSQSISQSVSQSVSPQIRITRSFNPSNGQLNPICHVLELLGAHHILHVSKTGVNENRNVGECMGLFKSRRNCGNEVRKSQVLYEVAGKPSL
jgi:hypothetical protein